MKMRQIATVFAVVLLAADVSSQDGVKPIPRMEQVRAIFLAPYRTRWEVLIHPNGAAILSFGGAGASFLDGTGAIAPQGSCSFKDVYNLLVPRLQLLKDQEEDMRVYFRGVSTNDSCAYYLGNTEENKGIVRKILRGLYAKAIPADEDIFEKTLRERPFVLGDDPIIHHYGKKADKTAFMAARNDLRPEVPDEDEKRVIDARLKILELAGHELPAADAGGVIPSSPESLQPPAPPPSSEPTTSPYLLPSLAAALAFCAGTVLWLTRRKKMRDTSP